MGVFSAPAQRNVRRGCRCFSTQSGCAFGLTPLATSICLTNSQASQQETAGLLCKLSVYVQVWRCITCQTAGKPPVWSLRRLSSLWRLPSAFRFMWSGITSSLFSTKMFAGYKNAPSTHKHVLLVSHGRSFTWMLVQHGLDVCSAAKQEVVWGSCAQKVHRDGCKVFKFNMGHMPWCHIFHQQSTLG